MKQVKYCECGCGQLVKGKNAKFCVGHSNKVKKGRDAISKRMTKNNPMKNSITAKKHSISISGKNHCNYGKKRSLITRMRQSKALKGKYVGEKHPMFGKKQSKEHIRKRIEPLIGRKLSEETRRKISKSKMGIKLGPFSEEHKRKISEGSRGKKISKETRRKLSETRKRLFYEGKLKSWNKGKPRSNSTKRKISLSNKGRIISEETKKKISKTNKGRIVSEETRKKLSENNGMKRPEIKEKHLLACRSEERRRKIGIKISIISRKRWKNPDYAERVIKNILKATRLRPTKPEIELNSLLNNLFPNEYKYVGDGEIIINGKNPDFINENQKKIVELYGDYFHNPKFFPKTQSESERIETFSKFGFSVLIVWEHELKNTEILSEKLINFNT